MKTLSPTVGEGGGASIRSIGLCNSVSQSDGGNLVKCVSLYSKILYALVLENV